MANKSISQLVRAEQVTPLDLFVLEQSGTAKKLTGQTLENWLLSFAEGHGGIQSIDKQGTSGLVDTYRITLSDASTVDFTVTNGKGISSVTKQSTSGLVDTYRMNYTDGTFTTFTVTNGEKGDKGDQTYVWIKWASTETPAPSDLSDYPEEYIGIYTGTAPTAPATPSSYRWYKYKGETGDRGDDAEVVEQQVEYAASDNRTSPPDSGWSTDFPVIRQGEFLWSRTTVLFNSGNDVVTYGVSYQGMDGSGAVSTVNNVEPVGGNITLTPSDLGAVSAVNGKTGSVTLYAGDIASSSSDSQTILAKVNAKSKVTITTRSVTYPSTTVNASAAANVSPSSALPTNLGTFIGYRAFYGGGNAAAVLQVTTTGTMRIRNVATSSQTFNPSAEAVFLKIE